MTCDADNGGLKLPQGFCALVAADGLGAARHLAVAPNGDVYVAESHTDVTDPNLIGRISVFDKNGTFLRIIGKAGTGPGELTRADMHRAVSGIDLVEPGGGELHAASRHKPSPFPVKGPSVLTHR